MSQLLKKSPQARCFCAPECSLCPGRRKCIVHSCADSRHCAFVVRMIRALLEERVDARASADVRLFQVTEMRRNHRAARRWLKVVEGSVKK